MDEKRTVRRLARAKVNLFLNVKGRRPDGYHELEMINARISLADGLSFVSGGDERVVIRSNDPYLQNHDNLVYFVARDLMESHAPDEHVTIEIDKRIPAGAGLAGNSADAAAVIEGLNELYQWGISPAAMRDFALLYGADIPYCFEPRPALVEGIGERITPLEIDLSEYAVLLVHPKVFVATDQVFKKGDMVGFPTYDIGPVLDAVRNKNLPRMFELLRNSLEEITFSLSPETKKAKEMLIALTGSDGVVMTGSGAAVLKIVNPSQFNLYDRLDVLSDKFSVNIYNFL